ncbi:MAG: hypothetical protein PHU07_04085 [Acidocella sp.]|nr:hypothetical protein [Acidocella sp.]
MPLKEPVTYEEHMAILSFIDRATGGEQAPIDLEAEAIIRACFKRNPEAAYRITKLAMALAAKTEPAPQPAKRPKTWFQMLIDRGHTAIP